MSLAGSPCNNVCRMDAATGWCLGCQRSISEITAWGGLDDAARRRVWALLPARREHMQAQGLLPAGLPALRSPEGTR